MRTLFEIIESVKNAQGAAIEELVFALLALDALYTFDRAKLRQLWKEVEKRSTDSTLRAIVSMSVDTSLKRVKKALNEDPKKWLGPDNIPGNPEYDKRRAAAIALFNAVVKDVKKKKEKDGKGNN